MANKQRRWAAQPGNDYEVGYSRPPKHSRFQPGHSGNARGRPKGSKNRRPGRHEQPFLDLIRREADRSITVNDNGRAITMPVAQAVFRTVSMNALKGQRHSQKLFVDLVNMAERRDRELSEQHLEAAISYQYKMTKELESCLARGIEPPEMLPHPDDIVIDIAAGKVEMIGPSTPEELRGWEELATKRDLARQFLKDFECQLEKARGKERALLKRAITVMAEREATLTSAVGEWPNHQRHRPSAERVVSLNAEG